jgi:phage protein D
VLHKLRRKQYTTSWEGKKDSEVAANIATLRDEGEKRFPLPIETKAEALGDEPVIDYLAQENQYDIDFLLYRARVRGYVVFVREESEQTPERHLYFGPSESPSPDETYELQWGTSLIDFTPTLTTANQVKSVTVNGWDRRRKKAISGKAELKDLRENRDFDEILQECDPREEVVVNRPVFTSDEAKKLAKALLKDRHKEMVKASGTTIGLPNLRAGRKIEIVNLGARFSGTYFVTESTHTISDSGYITRFKARREDEKSFMGVTQ